VTTLRRYVRQIVAPNGRHRPRPLLLPDEPIPAPAGPVQHAVLTEEQLLRLFDDGEAEVLRGARCPMCDCTTPHAMSRDSRRCWECGTTTKGDRS
jgi:hypothetical protein